MRSLRRRSVVLRSDGYWPSRMDKPLKLECALEIDRNVEREMMNKNMPWSIFQDSITSIFKLL